MAAQRLKPARRRLAAQFLGEVTVALLGQGAVPQLAGRECDRESGDAQPAGGLLLDGAIRVLQRLVERGQVGPCERAAHDAAPRRAGVLRPAPNGLLEGGLRHPRLSAVWGVEVLFGNRFSGRAQDPPEDSHTRARPRGERHPLIPALRQQVSDEEAARRGGLLPGATQGQPVERRGEEEEFVHTQTPTARLKRGHSGSTPREAEAPSGRGHFFLALAASFPERAQALAQKGRECCRGVPHTSASYSRAGEVVKSFFRNL